MSEQTSAQPSPVHASRDRRAGFAVRLRGRWPYGLGLVLAGAVAIAVVAGRSGGSPRPSAQARVSARPRALPTRAAGATASGAGATSGAGVTSSGAGVTSSGAGVTRSAVGGARAATGEIVDPQEASSYPAPASALHSAAAAPAKAGEAIVAAGAPSDAEVKAELKQMENAEKAAAQSARARLKPIPGGHSIGGNGTIPIPAGVPEVVQRVIAGANAIADFPYVYGGGHASFVDNAYDCSGSVSYALAAGGLIGQPETSGELESWGAPGPGRYITVLATAGHTYMYIDGILYDTAGRSGVFASRWQVEPTDNTGYVVRHWPGL